MRQWENNFWRGSCSGLGRCFKCTLLWRSLRSWRPRWIKLDLKVLKLDLILFKLVVVDLFRWGKNWCATSSYLNDFRRALVLKMPSLSICMWCSAYVDAAKKKRKMFVPCEIRIGLQHYCFNEFWEIRNTTFRAVFWYQCLKTGVKVLEAFDLTASK